MQVPKQLSGSLLVEALLASALFALIITGVVGAVIYGQQSTSFAGSHNRAILLAEEGLEATRNIRGTEFANLTDGTYGLAIVSNQWSLSGSSDTTDIFTRQIQISTINTTTKQATATITWQQNPQRTGSVALTTYFTNWQDISSLTGDWSNPLQIASIDIPYGQDGIKIQIQEDYAYVIRDGGNPDFIIIDISNPASPSIKSSLQIEGSQGNIAVLGDYVYLASEADLIIIDVSNPSSPVVVTTFNTGAPISNASGIFAEGSYVYMVGKNEEEENSVLVIINVSTPASPTSLSSLDLYGRGKEVIVMDNYAYAATDDNEKDLQVADISYKNSPNSYGELNLPESGNAVTITGTDTTIAIGKNDGTLITVDVSDPSQPSLLGSKDTGDDINDLSIGNNLLFLATGQSGKEFQIFNLTPEEVGFAAAAGDLNGIAYDADTDRAYAVGNDNNEEFIVLAPQ